MLACCLLRMLQKIPLVWCFVFTSTQQMFFTISSNQKRKKGIVNVVKNNHLWFFTIHNNTPNVDGGSTLTLTPHTPTPRTLTQHKKHNMTMATPSNYHAIVYNSPHSRAMASKPFSFSYQHPYASTDASSASVPLPFPRPAPTTITDTQIHDLDLSWPRPIQGEAISPLIRTKPLPLGFE
jgi:hypothetical protein